MPKAVDLLGQTFSRLKVVGSKRSRNGRNLWVCECSCGSGKEVVLRASVLKSGRVRSCGCLRSDVMREVAQKKKAKETGCNHDRKTRTGWLVPVLPVPEVYDHMQPKNQPYPATFVTCNKNGSTTFPPYAIIYLDPRQKIPLILRAGEYKEVIPDEQPN